MPSISPSIDSSSPYSLKHTQPSVILHRPAEIGCKPQPTIILHAAPVNTDASQFHDTQPDQQQDPIPSEPMSPPATQGPATYRNRYALYLASIFHISYEAALAESDYQLTYQSGSDDSGSESYELNRSYRSNESV
jgi:hypothetical protein